MIDIILTVNKEKSIWRGSKDHIGQDGNVDRVTRILNLVHSECVEMLFPYTKEEISDKQEPLDNVMTVPEEYLITLVLPGIFHCLPWNC